MRLRAASPLSFPTDASYQMSPMCSACPSRPGGAKGHVEVLGGCTCPGYPDIPKRAMRGGRQGVIAFTTGLPKRSLPDLVWDACASATGWLLPQTGTAGWGRFEDGRRTPRRSGSGAADRSPAGSLLGSPALVSSGNRSPLGWEPTSQHESQGRLGHNPQSIPAGLPGNIKCRNSQA